MLERRLDQCVRVSAERVELGDDQPGGQGLDIETSDLTSTGCSGHEKEKGSFHYRLFHNHKHKHNYNHNHNHNHNSRLFLGTRVFPGKGVITVSIIMIVIITTEYLHLASI